MRKFLVDFANEEEQHYLVAANDLHALYLKILPEPFDVALWHAYVERVVISSPFVRIGAYCILENISAGSARRLVQRALSAPFLNKENTKFLVLHQHEKLPHGEQIISALAASDLDESQLLDIELGARRGTVLYMRMAAWALNPKSMATIADATNMEMGSSEKSDIENFRIEQIKDLLAKAFDVIDSTRLYAKQVLKRFLLHILCRLCTRLIQMGRRP